MAHENPLVYGDSEARRSAASTKHECAACLRTFTTTGNLERHLEASKVCREWLQLPTRAPVQQPPAIPDSSNAVTPLTGTRIRDMLAVTGTRCAACGKEFTTVGSLARHYVTSVVCDRWRARRLLLELTSDFVSLTPESHPAIQSTGFPEPEEPGVDAAVRILPDAGVSDALPAPVVVGADKSALTQVHDQAVAERTAGP